MRKNFVSRQSAVAIAVLSSLAAAGALLAQSAQAEQLTESNAAGESLAAHFDRGGVVYAMTDAARGNEILVYGRDPGGHLHPLREATVRTGGAGGSSNAPVDPLGSQNSLVYDRGVNMLFAVNAGDNTVTAFDTGATGIRLRRTALVQSGGYLPVSVAVSGRLLYVLNAGGRGSVATFSIGDRGQLTRLDVLDLALANGAAIPFDQVNAPGQVGVDALARHLVVTNAGGQSVLVASLDDRGIPASPLSATASPGPAPFSFGTTPYGTLLVAEASGSVSAFDVPVGTTSLDVITAAVPTGQAATCWIVVHPNGYAFTSNTASDTISVYRYSRTGGLQLVQAVAASTSGAPTDMTFAGDGRLLYSLNAASGEILGFQINLQTGRLARVESQGGLPASAGIQGIAARDL